MFSVKHLTRAINGLFGQADRLQGTVIPQIAPIITSGPRGEFQIFDAPVIEPAKDPNVGRAKKSSDNYDEGNLTLDTVYVETHRYASLVYRVMQSDLDAVKSSESGVDLAKKAVWFTEKYLFDQLSYLFSQFAVTLTAANSGQTLDLTDPQEDLLGFLQQAQLECALAGGARPDTLLVNETMLYKMINLDQIRSTSAIAGVASGGDIARMGYGTAPQLEAALGAFGIKLVVDRRTLAGSPATSQMVFAAAADRETQGIGLFSRKLEGSGGNDLITPSIVPLGANSPEGVAVRGDLHLAFKAINENSARKVTTKLTP